MCANNVIYTPRASLIMARTKQNARANLSAAYSDKKIVTEDGKEVVVRRRHRKRPGTKARQEIRRYQSMGKYATMNVLAKEPFGRLVREIMQDMGSSDMRISKNAMDAIQQSAEDYMVGVFRAADGERNHAKRHTLYKEDVKRVIQNSKHLSEQV